VCRRVLRDAHDAEDAFQATFLVFVRRAAAVAPREAVGNWLYGVAYRTALGARRQAARRRAKETEVAAVPRPEPAADVWGELRPVLDEELNRLPDKYRLPVVLCDLEGRSRRNVACQLKVPEGTLSSRLATARKKLADRLTRRGLALTGGGLALLLAQNAAAACLPARLVGSAVQAALAAAAGEVVAGGVVSAKVAALADGVVRVMVMSKIKNVALGFLMVGAAGVGGGDLAIRAYSAVPGAVGIPSDAVPVASARDAADPPEQLSPQEARRRIEEARMRAHHARAEAEEARAVEAAARARLELATRRAEEAFKHIHELESELGPLARQQAGDKLDEPGRARNEEAQAKELVAHLKDRLQRSGSAESAEVRAAIEVLVKALMLPSSEEEARRRARQQEEHARHAVEHARQVHSAANRADVERQIERLKVEIQRLQKELERAKAGGGEEPGAK
jgi:RNA polymerase sigma factor (sigma-70 family)